jgi:hypothetical protein
MPELHSTTDNYIWKAIHIYQGEQAYGLYLPMPLPQLLQRTDI